MVKHRKLCRRKVLNNMNKIFLPNYCIKWENFSDTKQKKMVNFSTTFLNISDILSQYLTQYFAIIIKKNFAQKSFGAVWAMSKIYLIGLEGPPWAMLEVQATFYFCLFFIMSSSLFETEDFFFYNFDIATALAIRRTCKILLFVFELKRSSL